jgi:hypothetical protein
MMGDPAFANVLQSLVSVLGGLTSLIGNMATSTPPNGGPSKFDPIQQFDPVQQTPVGQIPTGQFPPLGGPGNSDFGHSQGNGHGHSHGSTSAQSV